MRRLAQTFASLLPMPKLVLCTLLAAVLLDSFYIKSVFSLKPFMAMTILTLIIQCIRPWRKLEAFELPLIIFFTTYAFSYYWSEVPSSSFRFGIGILGMFAFYVVCKETLLNLSIHSVFKCLLWVGTIFNLISMILYIMGLFAFSFSTQGSEHLRSFGVLVERGMFRNIGLLNDPNFFALFNGLFVFSVLYSPRDIFRFGTRRAILILCTANLLLSLSFGGIFALVISFVAIFRGLIAVVNLWILKYLGPLEPSVTSSFFAYGRYLPLRYIEKKILKGSGRYDLWAKAIPHFLESPFVGSGANASRFLIGRPLHNSSLDIALEAGFFSLLLLVTYLVWAYRRIQNTAYAEFWICTSIFYVIVLQSLSAMFSPIIVFWLSFTTMLATHASPHGNKLLAPDTLVREMTFRWMRR